MSCCNWGPFVPTCIPDSCLSAYHTSIIHTHYFLRFRIRNARNSRASIRTERPNRMVFSSPVAIHRRTARREVLVCSATFAAVSIGSSSRRNTGDCFMICTGWRGTTRRLRRHRWTASSAPEGLPMTDRHRAQAIRGRQSRCRPEGGTAVRTWLASKASRAASRHACQLRNELSGRLQEAGR